MLHGYEERIKTSQITFQVTQDVQAYTEINDLQAKANISNPCYRLHVFETDWRLVLLVCQGCSV